MLPHHLAASGLDTAPVDRDDRWHSPKGSIGAMHRRRRAPMTWLKTAVGGLGPPAARVLLLLWLAGMGLRLTVLAIPPLIPLLHEDLHLSQTGIGLLTGLPALLFAAAAVPGALCIARFGPVRTLVVGLLLTAGASALRGAAPNAVCLYGTTFLMGVGIALMQPTLPRLVRDWVPERL